MCVFRIFGLEFLDELVKIEAHDSEVLCLAFSPTSTGKTSGSKVVTRTGFMKFLQLHGGLSHRDAFNVMN